eukprot:PhM_4_TR14158/c0_g1_i12/m.51510/K05673/ABCC4; ATP-binding cassette, subfamily C (CFTR/MRP), member 4
MNHTTEQASHEGKNKTKNKEDDSSSKPQPPPPEFRPPGLSTFSFLSRHLFFFFVGPLVTFANDPSTPTVSTDNLWEIPDEDRVQEIVKIFDHHRHRSASRKAFYHPLYMCARRHILIGGFFMLLKVVCDTFIPVLVREIIAQIRDSSFDGLYYVLGMFGVALVGQMSHQLHLLFMETGCNRMRAVCNLVLYRHAMSLRAHSMGDGLSALITAVASDTQRFVDVYPYAHLLWASPLQIALGTYFAVTFMGVSALLSIGVLFCMYPLTFILSHLQSSFRTKLLPQTQERVRLIAEFLQGVKVMKMYGWENYLVKAVSEVRARELGYSLREVCVWGANMTLLVIIPNWAMAATFWLYVNVKGSLNAADVFATLSMLVLLKFPILFFGQASVLMTQTVVGCTRIIEFLERQTAEDGAACPATTHTDEGPNEPFADEANGTELSTVAKDDSNADGHKSVVSELQSVVSRWEPGVDTFEMPNLDIKIVAGEVYAVVGSVGSGKTMFCMTLLQEAYVTKGRLSVPRGVAYCAQEPFLISGTVRDNILFRRPFDEQRYLSVLDACQLWPDLEAYPDGEMTIVGERGVTLSGGQKARIALARVAYADDCDMVLLDDPFSALDVRTGHLILEALLGDEGLFRRRQSPPAVVMVTHAKHNLKYADHVVAMHKGVCLVEPNPDDIEDDVEDDPDDADEGDLMVGIVAAPSNRRLRSEAVDKLVENEQRDATVRLRTYWDYLSYGGGLLFVFSILIGLSIERVCFVSMDFWLAVWTSAENGKPTHILGEWHDLPSGADFDGAAFYLKVYIVLLCVCFTFVLGRLSVMAIGGVTAAVRLFKKSFAAILSSPMIFFDVNPAGRILNRMSYDVERTGYILITQLNSTMATWGWMIAGIVVTAFVVPYTLLLVLPAYGVVLRLMYRFRAVNVHLQRIDSGARSNLQGHIVESVSGAVTVRCFGRTADFMRGCEDQINVNSRALFGVAMCQRWLAVRAETVGVFMTSSVVFMAWLFRDTLPAGTAAMSIIWGMNLSRTITYIITEGVQGEAKLVSVERLVEYVDTLPSEPPRTKETDPVTVATTSGKNPSAKRVPATWPSLGRVEFKDVRMRYRPSLPLVLDGTSFTIEAGQRVGVVGRTGSGKSSLIVALFRLREIEGGCIEIDGRDISQLGLDCLRGGRMCIIPQDPVLFSGTVRSNVDPFDEYEDAQITHALGAVQLLEYVQKIGGIGAFVEDRGRNFSVGQKQLICIARALLRRPCILLMDEATANVDHETDQVIQRAVRELFASATVIEIAHRLHTVMDTDRVVVMSDGRVIEVGSPHALLQDTSGVFHDLVEATGPTTSSELRKIAKMHHKN